jgi:diguanylate cyclase (GGDEF)-like protein/PAS domain S-box-containing protein
MLDSPPSDLSQYRAALRRGDAAGSAAGSPRAVPAVHTRIDELARANAALQAEIREHQRAEAELREAKERLALALEGSRLALWDLDVTSGSLYLSEQWAAMLGDLPRAVRTSLPEMFELITHPNERDALYANYAAAVKGLVPEYRVEHRIRARSGQWKWILSHGKVMERAPNGHALRMIGTNADITERKQAEHALADRLAELRLVQDHAPAMIAYFDGSERCRYANRQYAAFLESTPEDLVGRNARGILGAGYEAVREHTRKALQGHSVSYERRHVRRDGRPQYVVVQLVPHRGADGLTQGFYGMMIDITERKRAEDQIRESEQRFRDVVDASGEYVWETDAEWRYRYLSKRAEFVLGHPIEHLLGRRSSDFMPAGEAERVSRWIAANSVPGGSFTDLEHMMVAEAGDIRWQWLSGKPVRDETGAVIAYRGTGANITERKRHEARIEQLATRDALTGLPNRTLLQDRLAHAVAGERREHGLLATMFIDVDRFKTINDSLGHHIGDALLQQMAARLVGCVGDEDTVARSGGDEFVVVAARMRQAEDAAQLARTILRRLNAAYVVEGHQLVATCSIGISLYPGDGDDSDLLLKHADTAMYHAKAAGGDSYRFFSAEMNARAVERLSLENDLRRALENGDLELHYQPVVDMGSGSIVGVEALARWSHAGRGMVPPARFIAIAEETGLIAPLGEWALTAACRQARAWHDAGHRALKVAVNLSPNQLRDGRDFAHRVGAILRDTGFDPTCLELEITESLLVNQVESNFDALRLIADLGARLVVDDFGMGYSSLGYLKRLPIHGLKIDRSFVRDIVADADDAAIVRAVISLARSLQLSVTAEGVETGDQLLRLRELSCERWQGFLLSPAVSAEAFAAQFLSAGSSES